VSRWKRLADKHSSVATLHVDAEYEQEYLTRSGSADGNSQEETEEYDDDSFHPSGDGWITA